MHDCWIHSLSASEMKSGKIRLLIHLDSKYIGELNLYHISLVSAGGVEPKAGGKKARLAPQAAEPPAQVHIMFFTLRQA